MTTFAQDRVESILHDLTSASTIVEDVEDVNERELLRKKMDDVERSASFLLDFLKRRGY